MREIEFRGKRLDTGEWVYGYYRCIAWNFDSPTHQIINGNTFYGVDPATVGQYTGLRDKKCKKIYEGDIIRIRETKEDDWEIYVVKYYGDEGYPAFDTDPQINCDCNGLSYAMAACEVEIIGNIHDNPELLESDIILVESNNHEYFPTIPSQSQ
jgi:uncharacterized phage protein (TIGR01671 family)